MVDFLRAGGQFHLAPAVYDGDFFRAHAQRAARGVHGHVAPADHGGALAHAHGREMVGEIVSLHQIDAGQEFVGRIHAAQVFARDALEARQARAAADESRVVGGEQFVQRGEAAHHAIDQDVHAHGAQGIDFLFHQRLGQAEFRNAVH